MRAQWCSCLIPIEYEANGRVENVIEHQTKDDAIIEASRLARVFYKNAGVGCLQLDGSIVIELRFSPQDPAPSKLWRCRMRADRVVRNFLARTDQAYCPHCGFSIHAYHDEVKS